jgi:hypothetical protein
LKQVECVAYFHTSKGKLGSNWFNFLENTLLKTIYILSAVIISNAALAETRTVLVNPGQIKTLIQPHAKGSNCLTGQVRISIIKSPKLGSISVNDKKVNGCNGKRLTYRPHNTGKDSATIKVSYPDGSSQITKYKLKIK